MIDERKVIKKQRKRFSQRKREIREEVREEFIELIKEKVKSFAEYLEGLCNEGHDQSGTERKTEEGKGVS